MEIDIVGWHLHEAAARCRDCDEGAAVWVTYSGDCIDFHLCNQCLTNYTVREDKIAEVFRKLGL